MPAFLKRPGTLIALVLIATGAWGGLFFRLQATGTVRRHLDAGIALAHQARTKAAEAQWQAALALDPNNAEAWNLLGEMYLAARNWTGGADAFRQLARVWPDAPHVHGNFAICLYQSGDRMGGYAEAQKELTRDPDFIPALLICGRMASELSQQRQAGDYLQRLTRHLPDNSAVHRLYAEFLVDQNHPAEAISVLEHLLRLAPNDAEAYSLRGKLAYENDLSPDGMHRAEADFQHAADLNPRAPFPRLYLGKLYRRQGQSAQAVAELEAAHQIAPKKMDICFELAQAYEQAGSKQQAAQMRQRFAAMQRDSALEGSLKKRCVAERDNFDYHLQLGRLTLKNGDIWNATYYLNRAALLRPKDERAQNALRDLAVALRKAPPQHDIAAQQIEQQLSGPVRL